MVKDPICGMAVDSEHSRFNTHCDGKNYFFCSDACKEKFLNLRSSHLKKKSWFTRLLEWLASANQKRFGNTPPSCCGHDQ